MYNSKMKKDTGSHRLKGFTSILAMVLLVYLSAVGTIQRNRLEKQMRLMTHMEEYESITYAKAMAISYMKGMMKMGEEMYQGQIDGHTITISIKDLLAKIEIDDATFEVYYNHESDRYEYR